MNSLHAQMKTRLLRQALSNRSIETSNHQIKLFVMKLPSRASLRLARTALYCLAISASSTPAIAQDLLAWREAKNMTGLVAHLDVWLDANTNLPRRDTAATISMTSPTDALALAGINSAINAETVRGLYDSASTTIWLVYPWSLKDPRDVSVLLHELVHHRQAEAGHWYCPGAQELPAYKTQQAWLDELGLELNANWIAVVLEAGCTPRDIHPD